MSLDITTYSDLMHFFERIEIAAIEVVSPVLCNKVKNTVRKVHLFGPNMLPNNTIQCTVDTNIS